jgi:hypothetical protein
MLSKYHVEKAEHDHRRSRDLNVNAHFLKLQEAKFLDRAQRREERAERWKLEKKERETWLRRSARREDVLLGMTVLFAASALVLLFVAVDSGGIYAAGGSGLSWFASIRGMINLALMQPPQSEPAVAPRE